jgi:hypothetical protein
MTVDDNISDLFFNTGLTECAKENADGTFAGYDDVMLRAEAILFLQYLDRMGVIGVPRPSVDELLADFYGRI